ncbi:hypothetical protein EWM64_g9767 [Hericium alpestre]|uniref:Uncharacterized protein n=1 Tax=Hericium alpestre TaxID=135208 RepID=A0A4Y9ZHN0_9AGAM|nr:hypothetical protein EWM64_g9767 [Hericium alpestre]
MISKLHVKLKEAAFRANVSNPKAHASGYSHTYFDVKGMDLHDLALFSDDAEISRMSQEACKDIEALISLLSIQPAYLKQPADGRVGLPSIVSWYGNSSGTGCNNNEMTDDDSDTDNKSICDVQELQDLIDAEEAGKLGTEFSCQDDEAFLHLKYAAIAVTINEFMQMYVHSSNLY